MAFLELSVGLLPTEGLPGLTPRAPLLGLMAAALAVLNSELLFPGLLALEEVLFLCFTTSDFCTFGRVSIPSESSELFEDLLPDIARSIGQFCKWVVADRPGSAVEKHSHGNAKA